MFISYSWTSEDHQLRVKSWADRLIADGIDVVLDIYELKEGQDKYAFMERMVTDKSVTHVLVCVDKKYKERADSREAGVGTESQIISKNVYEKVKQSKFIPVVCERDEGGNRFLPTFFESRIFIDFSSDEAVNKNWEQLVRLLYGKPQFEKPKLGRTPSYVLEEALLPTTEARSKFEVLAHAIRSERSGLRTYRTDFLDACISYVDELRIRDEPPMDTIGQRIIDDCGKLRSIRNLVVDWILLESAFHAGEEFAEAVITLLEHLLEMKSQPKTNSRWQEAYAGAHTIFVYETFLYIVAALVKATAYETLHQLFTAQYLLPEDRRNRENPFVNIDAFYGHCDAIQQSLGVREGGRYHSAAAELISRQADRNDIPFSEVIQAELLTYLIILITPDARWWYPGTLHYVPYGSPFPLFLRAAQHRHFAKLVTITGVDDAEKLRQRIVDGFKDMGSRLAYMPDIGILLNMAKWDSIN